MRIALVYPAFKRHADAHPELRELVPAEEYLGPPSLGLAALAAATPGRHELLFVDDRLEPLDLETEADLFAISCFTPAATRALELARQLRARGRQVVLGGIFPSMLPDEAGAACSAVVIGEGEELWPGLLADAERGRLRPRYEATGPVDLAAQRRPRVELYLDAERPHHRPHDYPVQLSRGCPFACDACVLPGQLGRRIRFHPEQTVWELLELLAGRGKRVCLTEDTSLMGAHGARRRLRALLGRCAEARRRGVEVRFTYLGTTVALLQHLDPTLLEALREVGLDRFYLVCGFDAITRAAFGRGDPSSLKRAELAVRRCQDHGIEPYVSFLVGNPEDDEGVFDRILAFAARTSLRIAEFAIATPYPGTPWWRRYREEGRIIDTTWERYNDANVVFRPHGMSAERLLRGYLELWRGFYLGRRQDLATAPRLARTIQF